MGDNIPFAAHDQYPDRNPGEPVVIVNDLPGSDPDNDIIDTNEVWDSSENMNLAANTVCKASESKGCFVNVIVPAALTLFVHDADTVTAEAGLVDAADANRVAAIDCTAIGRYEIRNHFVNGVAVKVGTWGATLRVTVGVL